MTRASPRFNCFPSQSANEEHNFPVLGLIWAAISRRMPLIQIDDIPCRFDDCFTTSKASETGNQY